MVLIGLGLFLSVFLLAGGHIVFNKQVVPLFAGMIGVMWAVYHMLMIRRRRYAGDAFRGLARREFRWPGSRPRAAGRSSGGLCVERSLCGRRTAVGAGQRRECHLARSYFENLPDAGIGSSGINRPDSSAHRRTIHFTLSRLSASRRGRSRRCGRPQINGDDCGKSLVNSWAAD